MPANGNDTLFFIEVFILCALVVALAARMALRRGVPAHTPALDEADSDFSSSSASGSENTTTANPPSTVQIGTVSTGVSLLYLLLVVAVSFSVAWQGGAEVLAAVEDNTTTDVAALRRDFDAMMLRSLLLAAIIGVAVAAGIAELHHRLMRPLAIVAKLAAGDPFGPSAPRCLGEVCAEASSAGGRVEEVRHAIESFAGLLDRMNTIRPFLPEGLVDGGDEPDVPGLATGYATVVFTDIQSSTNTWAKCPADMKPALAMHNQIVREAIAKWSGYEVKTVGDSFIVAFEESHDAVHFGLEVQVALYSCTWPEGLLKLPQCARNEATQWNGLRLRIGINTGDVDVVFSDVNRRYDYFGTTMNKAARAEACGIAGAVCLTTETCEDLRLVDLKEGREGAGLPEDLEYFALEAAMKGIESDRTLTVVVPGALAKRGEDVQADIALKQAGRYTSPALSGDFDRGASELTDITPWMMPGSPVNPLTKGRSRRRSTLTTSPIARYHRARRRSVFTPEAQHDRQAWVGEFTNVSRATVAKVFVSMGSVDACESLTQLTALLSRIVALVRRLDGSVMGIDASAARIAWNVTRTIPNHVQRALHLPQMLAATANRNALLNVYVGVGVGTGMYGTLALRRDNWLTLLGGLVPLTDVLCTTAAGLDVPCLLASMPGTANLARCKAPAPLRPIDTWTIIGHGTTTIWQVAVSEFSAVADDASSMPLPRLPSHRSGLSRQASMNRMHTRDGCSLMSVSSRFSAATMRSANYGGIPLPPAVTSLSVTPVSTRHDRPTPVAAAELDFEDTESEGCTASVSPTASAAAAGTPVSVQRKLVRPGSRSMTPQSTASVPLSSTDQSDKDDRIHPEKSGTPHSIFNVAQMAPSLQAEMRNIGRQHTFDTTTSSLQRDDPAWPSRNMSENLSDSDQCSPTNVPSERLISTSWGWSEQYAAAFRAGDHIEMTHMCGSNCTDKILCYVASNIAEDRHFQPPLCLT